MSCVVWWSYVAGSWGLKRRKRGKERRGKERIGTESWVKFLFFFLYLFLFLTRTRPLVPKKWNHGMRGVLLGVSMTGPTAVTPGNLMQPRTKAHIRAAALLVDAIRTLVLGRLGPRLHAKENEHALHTGLGPVQRTRASSADRSLSRKAPPSMPPHATPRRRGFWPHWHLMFYVLCKPGLLICVPANGVTGCRGPLIVARWQPRGRKRIRLPHPCAALRCKLQLSARPKCLAPPQDKRPRWRFQNL